MNKTGTEYFGAHLKTPGKPKHFIIRTRQKAAQELKSGLFLFVFFRVLKVHFNLICRAAYFLVIWKITNYFCHRMRVT